MLSHDHFLDFLCIGAPRCGTTWLAACLTEHPSIFIPHNKEIHFFNTPRFRETEYKYPLGIARYRNYFIKASAEQLLGEVSPHYYCDVNAARRIQQAFPNAKLIVILRYPVDMLFSWYLKRRKQERCARTFEAELSRRPDIVRLGLYYENLVHYFDRFSTEQIHVILYEELFQNEIETLDQILRFLGLTGKEAASLVRGPVNAYSHDPPKWQRTLFHICFQFLLLPPMHPVKRFLHRVRLNKADYSVRNAARKPQLSKEAQTALDQFFLPDIGRLESLLGRSLDGWRRTLDPSSSLDW